MLQEGPAAALRYGDGTAFVDNVPESVRTERISGQRIAITSRYFWADYVRTPPNKTPLQRTGKVMHAGSYYTRSASSGRSIPCHSASHVASCSSAGVKDVSGLGAGDSALIPQFLEAGTLDVTM